MRIRLTLFLTAILLALPTLSAAQPASGDSLSRPRGSADVAETEIRLSHELVPAGTSFRAAIRIRLDNGWHINAHRPTLDYLIGTEISLRERSGISLLSTRYSKPHERDFGFADRAIAVYEGNVPVLATFAVPDTLDPGDYVLRGSLRVQACRGQICLSPANIPLRIPLKVGPKGADAVNANTDFFDKFASDSVFAGRTASGTDAPSPEVVPPGRQGNIAAMFERQGSIWAFLGIFLIGLALNLTPCVYPMLSVTVSLFGGESGNGEIGRSFAMATAYVLGIAFMYSVLGVAAAYTGSLFGSWLQNPWVTAGIGVLMLGLALSMFGLYELRMPRNIRQKLGGMGGTTGAVGHFLSGLAVGVFAAPCIGPPVVALLAFVGSQGDPLFGFAAFFVLSLGLGLPYLLLGTFSGLLAGLPQSGSWMVWVKKVFGIILLGVAAFYLALAVYPAYAVYTVPVVLLGGGIYLGFLEDTENGSRIFRYSRWGVAAAAIVAGVLFVQNLRKPAMHWEPYSPEKLEQARAGGQPVMLDFHADWCIPCHELEHRTYTDPEVKAASAEFKKLKVDLTNYESARSRSIREEYDIRSVPTIVFIGGSGREVEEARITGFVGPEAFVEKVKIAR